MPASWSAQEAAKTVLSAAGSFTLNKLVTVLVLKHSRSKRPFLCLTADVDTVLSFRQCSKTHPCLVQVNAVINGSHVKHDSEVKYHCRVSGRGPRMHQPVAVGAAPGTASGLLVALLRQFLAAPPVLEVPSCSVPDVNFEVPHPGWLHAPSLCCGVAIGLLLGPLLDLLWLWRQRLRRYIWVRAGARRVAREGGALGIASSGLGV